MDILKNEAFMDAYYDSTAVPPETELDTDEFRCRLESWYTVCGVVVTHRATYNMFKGVKMRRNGEWFAMYGSTVEGRFCLECWKMIARSL